ncbi:hypothetical protein BGZ51_002870 [Haplosporangium sp. Z 767]|nr:hypothetical protein BGZ51_002870 [Haplosporangium sp. Z 767]
MVAPTNGTVENIEPFNLVLRALSGQRYNILSGVAQDLFTVTVQVPMDATGGKHSFYAYYTGNLKATSSNQFNVSGPIVTPATETPTTTLPTNTQGSGAPSTTPTSTQGSDGGISGAALGGIIGGVTAFLLFIALIFFFRHRRRVREQSQHTRLEDTKEGYSETSIPRSGPPAGPPSGGMMPVPLSDPGSHSPHSKEQPYGDSKYGDPLTQHRMQHANGNRNPFETPDDKMMGAAAMGGAPSLSPRQQHQPYQPPQYEQPPPRPQQQQPYGMPNQVMPRSQSPFQQNNRESFESEPESAYDPNRTRMNNGVSRNNSNAMVRGGPPGSSQLVHSPSGRSIASNPRQHMSPQPQHQNIAHPHQQQNNPFHDRELMAAAAGSAMGAAVGHHGSSNSPVPAHRPSPQNQLLNSPMSRSREIEMQPLDVQQHQYEQQQRALQRQQQQQQQQNSAVQEQQQKPAQPTSPTSVPPTTQTTAPTIGVPKNPFNPTLYDDKTEVDEEGASVYNGYRDTIFGAYVQPQGDDEDDNDVETPVPNVPSSALAQAGNQAQQKQPSAAENSGDAPAGVQRKKSVKFTGVPASGPIVVPDGQEQQKQRQLYHSDADEDEDEEDYVDENEDDIKLRLMATEVPSPASSHSRPTMINTSHGSPPVNGQNQNVLSPVRSPNQSYGSSSSPYQQGSPVRSDHGQQGGFVPPPPGSLPSHNQLSSGSPSLNAVSSSIGDGFYEDVLAAVDKNAKTLPSSTAAMTATSPTTSQQQQSYVPAPSSQHLHPVPLEKEVFGAPSPRITPAAAAPVVPPGFPSPKVVRPPAPNPNQQQQRQYRDDEENAFYDSSLL